MRVAFLTILMISLIPGVTAHVAENKEQVSNVPHFGICHAIIKNAIVEKQSEDREAWVIVITLNSVGSEQLLSFSRQHLEEIVEVVFDGAVLLRTRVMNNIDSGVILTGPWSSSDVAKEMIFLLGNQSLGAPCGPIEE